MIFLHVSLFSEAPYAWLRLLNFRKGVIFDKITLQMISYDTISIITRVRIIRVCMCHSLRVTTCLYRTSFYHPIYTTPSLRSFTTPFTPLPLFSLLYQRMGLLEEGVCTIVINKRGRELRGQA